MRLRWLFILLLAYLSLTACSAVPDNNTVAGADMAANAEAVPAWFNIPILDVRTNSQISLANYGGKTVVVEAMAVWCGECFYQQTQAAVALAQLNRDDVVYISLDIDPSGEPSLLADYSVSNQFNWTFVRSNPEIMEPLIAQFGRTITVPSNMPIFFISPTGRVSELYTGGHTASQLIELIEQWSEA